ncbi:DUF4123 domain-containing protein [Endozoicomonas sp. SM1973]|uniref:DUF4123 domain-containing protein n=1 Tax=Spartinivicinus marinus TaxID=2994442 RepID=A0A853IAS8_9GAMM|nr:DUF4123 domain-containing protein [Spartinivicinus marinus]MCX4026692.1 DUF4123 domain-containing protein [Spartinivicinus marinus]NYZ64526.1 DUF4123 domain-containing protein [Spartinivicinus marinus]
MNKNELIIQLNQPEYQSSPLYFIIDSLTEDKLYQNFFLYKESDPYAVLYQQTRFNELYQAGPIFVQTSINSPLADYLLNNLSHWGWLFISEAPFEKLVEHFRWLITAKYIIDGSTVIFRYQDPRVLYKLIPALTPAESLQLFNSIDQIWIQDLNKQWQEFILNSQTLDKTQAENVPDSEKNEMFILSRKMLEATGNDNVLIDNLQKELWHSYPVEMGRLLAHGELENMLLHILKEAKNLGFTAYDQLRKFIIWSGQHGVNFQRIEKLRNQLIAVETAEERFKIIEKYFS